MTTTRLKRENIVQSTDSQKTQESSTGYVDKQDSNESSSRQLVKKEDVKGTPFHILSVEEDKHIIALGNYKVAEVSGSILNARKEAKRVEWNKLYSVVCISVQQGFEFQKELNKEKND